MSAFWTMIKTAAHAREGQVGQSRIRGDVRQAEAASQRDVMIVTAARATRTQAGTAAGAAAPESRSSRRVLRTSSSGGAGQRTPASSSRTRARSAANPRQRAQPRRCSSTRLRSLRRERPVLAFEHEAFDVPASQALGHDRPSSKTGLPLAAGLNSASSSRSLYDRPVKERPDGRLGDAEHAADLLVLETLDVLEDEDPPLPAGEPGDGPAEAEPDVRPRFSVLGRDVRGRPSPGSASAVAAAIDLVLSRRKSRRTRFFLSESLWALAAMVKSQALGSLPSAPGPSGRP